MYDFLFSAHIQWFYTKKQLYKELTDKQEKGLYKYKVTFPLLFKTISLSAHLLAVLFSNLARGVQAGS